MSAIGSQGSSSFMRGYMNYAGKAVKGVAASTMGAPLLFGMALAPMTYDPTKNSFASHMGGETVKAAAEGLFDLAMFSTLGALGPVGTAAAMGAAFMRPGYAMAEHFIQETGKSYRRAKGLPDRPITQNERTMQATQSQAQLLGRAGKYSMLGSEAAYMHT